MDPITTLCNAVMRGVVASGAVTEARIGPAVEIMRAEVKAFLFGPAYGAERELAVQTPDGSRLAVAVLVAECVVKIKRV